MSLRNSVSSKSRGNSRLGRFGVGVTAAVLATLTMAPSAVAQVDNPYLWRDRDFTRDAVEDLLSRKPNGQLAISAHSGTFNGTATYGASVPINNGWNNAHWISAGDVTGDTAPDVLAEVNGVIEAHKHNGTYSPANPWATLNGKQQYGGFGWNHFDNKVLADLDGNGLVDMIGRSPGNGDIFVWLTGLNNGQIVVNPAEQIGSGFTGIDQLDFADLNLDGLGDLVFRDGGALVAFYGQPAPEAPPATKTAEAKSGDRETGVVRTTVFEYSGKAEAKMAAPEFQILSEGWDLANAFEIKDVNLDQKPDLVSRLTSGGQLVAFLNTTTTTGEYSWFTGQNALGTGWSGDSFIS